MQTDVKQANNVTVIAVSESIDALTATALSKVISEQIANGHAKLVVDFGGVDFMSSAGLRTLLGAVKEARSVGGDLCVAAPNPGVDKVLSLSGFHNVTRVFATTAEAIASLG